MRRHLVVAVILVVHCEHHAVVHLNQGLLEFFCVGFLTFLLGEGIDCFKAVGTDFEQSIQKSLGIPLEPEGQVPETLQDLCLQVSVDVFLHVFH